MGTEPLRPGRAVSPRVRVPLAFVVVIIDPGRS